MMKDAALLVLVALLAIAVLGRGRDPQAAIQDTTLLRRADLPAWKPPSVVPDDGRLFAPCPITPWALPTHSKEHPV
jgi:hypothetical protein